MNGLLTCGLCSVAAYLLGAVPFGFLLARWRGVDIRTVGSGNIGATNVFRCVGRGWGVLTFIGDAIKGFVPAFLFPRLAAALGAPPWTFEPCAVLGACSAVIGHTWPVYLRFRGGKGVATSAGALLGIAWLHVLAGVAVWGLVFVLTRYVSVASMTAAAAIATAAWLTPGHSSPLVPSALTLLAALVVWRHRANIQRLVKGTEHRFTFKKKPATG